MKILIVPMAAIAETAGPFSRAEILAKSFLENGFQVALCAANNVNFKEIDDVRKYHLSVPVPMGLPKHIGLCVYPIADKLGVIGRKTIHSFEEVLHLTGANSYLYFKASIAEIRSAIIDFQPDVIYSEFNLSAIVAAKIEYKTVIATYSFPTQPAYAASPQFAKDVNKVLNELEQPQVKSTLDLFRWADFRIVPSSYDLEPIDDEKTLFVGALKKAPAHETTDYKNCVLVYMGNGTIAKSRLLKIMTKAFYKSAFEVYIAGAGFQELNNGNIHIAHRFNFSDLLPKTAVFINHGGQNSIMDSLIYGVPQIVCPGKVFERNYNADSVVKNGAGLKLDLSEFHEDIIINTVNRLISDKSFQEKAKKLGNFLQSLGGAEAVSNYISTYF